jgi:hypothetical protein
VGTVTAIATRDGLELTPTERKVWDEYVARHRSDLSAAMAHALFDDVRPAWERYYAGRREAVEPQPAAQLSDAGRASVAMSAALFDDVRPAWEASLSTTATA